MNKDKTGGLGEHIRAIRKLRKMSQLEVGEKVGCSQSCISAIEKGRQPLTTAMLCRLEVALNFKTSVRFTVKEVA